MDGKVNESTPNLPWLIVLDAAPIHVAVDFRKRLYTDLPWEHVASRLRRRSCSHCKVVPSSSLTPVWLGIGFGCPEVAITKTMARVHLCNEAWDFRLVPEKTDLLSCSWNQRQL
eukprot:1157429-Amphidinium_carterae.1